MKAVLLRVLEAEVMDAPGEARDYDAMDHGEVNRQFVADFLFAWAGKPAGEILDLGTGTAQIPIVLCKSDSTAGVLATDMAQSMLEIAAQNVQAAGFHDRIRLERADAKTLPHADRRFAAVMSNSIVHHIRDPRRVLAEAVRVTAEGGLLFVRDLLRPANDETVLRLVEMYAGNENDHQQAMFDASLRAALSLEEIRHLVGELGFDSNSVGTTSDRHWTWSARKP